MTRGKRRLLSVLAWLGVAALAVACTLDIVRLARGGAGPSEVLVSAAAATVAFAVLSLGLHAAVQESERGSMTPRVRTLVYWTPRAAAALFAAFLAVFAADVFGEGGGFWRTLGALLLHLLPAAAFAGALVVSWRREWLGALLFGGFGALSALSGGNFPFVTNVIMSGLPLSLGLLFVLNWRHRAELRPREA